MRRAAPPAASSQTVSRACIQALLTDDEILWEDDVVDPWDASIVPVGLAGEQLRATAPGPELADLLEHANLSLADDHALVEVVAAWQRMESWVAAGMAHAAAVLADRPSMNPGWPASAGHVGEQNVTGEELSMRLGCSRRAAWLLVRDGRAFEGALAWTGEALERGEIDTHKARILVDALVDRPVPLALDVQEALLPGAARRTPAQLAKDVAREIITRDPAGAREQHLVGLTRRRVDAPRVLADGMAGIWAVLPAIGAVRLDSALDTLARGARAAGDPRTLAQLRADLLVDLTAGDVEGTAARAALAPRPLGADGAVPGPSEVFRSTAGRTEIRVTVPLSTLVGLDDGPAELDRYGPITAETARALARGGTWRRLVTDPLTGRVLDIGRTRYRPPADLVAHVQARDGTCAGPACSTRAESCDLDHTVEYHRDGGTTSVANLGPLCPRDHQVKTDGGFHLAQVEPGVFEWTTPTGHRYRVEPGTGQPCAHLPRHDDPPPF